MAPPIPPKTLASLIDFFSDVTGGFDVMEPVISVIFVMFVFFVLDVLVVEVVGVSSGKKKKKKHFHHSGKVLII